MTVNNVKRYLGGKSACCLYMVLYHEIASGHIRTMYAVKTFLQKVFKGTYSGLGLDNYSDFREEWIKQAEDVWNFIETC